MCVYAHTHIKQREELIQLPVDLLASKVSSPHCLLAFLLVVTENPRGGSAERPLKAPQLNFDRKGVACSGAFSSGCFPGSEGVVVLDSLCSSAALDTVPTTVPTQVLPDVSRPTQVPTTVPT